MRTVYLCVRSSDFISPKRFYDTPQAENGEGHLCFILRGKNPVTPSPLGTEKSAPESSSRTRPCGFAQPIGRIGTTNISGPLGSMMWTHGGTSGWWFEICFKFHPRFWGNDPIWGAYFSRWIETTNYCSFGLLIFRLQIFWSVFSHQNEEAFALRQKPYVWKITTWCVQGNDFVSYTFFWCFKSPSMSVFLGEDWTKVTAVYEASFLDTDGSGCRFVPIKNVRKLSATDGTNGSKYCFQGFGSFDSGPSQSLRLTFFLPGGKQNRRLILDPVYQSWRVFFMWVKNEGF